MDPFLKSAGLLFVLLNPFLMGVYLMDLIQTLDGKTFRRAMIQGTAMSGAVFVLLAWTGEILFTHVLQVRFSSFLIFGGGVFLIVATRFVFEGTPALQSVRGAPEHIAGSIAMPFMIGPATVSASVIIGQRLPFPTDAIAVCVALVMVVVTTLAFKAIHDWVRKENERFLARCVDITGRVTALVMGTFAVEMILKGIDLWLAGRVTSP